MSRTAEEWRVFLSQQLWKDHDRYLGDILLDMGRLEVQLTAARAVAQRYVDLVNQHDDDPAPDFAWETLYDKAVEVVQDMNQERLQHQAAALQQEPRYGTPEADLSPDVEGV